MKKVGSKPTAVRTSGEPKPAPPRLGAVVARSVKNSDDGGPVEEQACALQAACFENSAPMLFDVVMLPDVAGGLRRLIDQTQGVDFVVQEFRHGKTLCALGASKALLDRAGVDTFLGSGEESPGILLVESDELDSAQAALIVAIGKQRHPAHETDSRQV